LISVAKRGLAPGGNAVHARRLAAQVITDPQVTKRLFDEIAPLFTDRPGGYTRLVKVGPRMGDGAEMAVLELVERPAAKTSETGKK
jgi:large subunit ribosomal protein L17